VCLFSLSIIIPTQGRIELARTLHSIDPQMSSNDEVILVADERGNPKYVEWLAGMLNVTWDSFGIGYRVFVQPTGKPVGQPLRNFGIEQATKDYIVWIGDDDIFTGDAFEKIRAALAENPGKVHMFKWNSWQAGLLPRNKKIEEGNVGDHPIVAPNDQSKLGRFGMRYAGDYDFVRATVDNFGGEENVVWRNEMIAICRPERFEKKGLGK